jgi:hypothetical protein
MPRPIAGHARVSSASQDEKFLPCVNAPATILNWFDGRAADVLLGIIDLYEHNIIHLCWIDIEPFAGFMAERVGW